MSDYELVFVGGIGRSGSTLIERLLGELPGVCSVGEVVHMWRRSLVDDEWCGCGEPFSGCSFWRAVGAEAFGGWGRVDAHEVLALKDAVDRTRFVPGLLRAEPGGHPDLVHRYTALYDRLYAAIAQVSGCRVVVDSSKHASLAACLRLRYHRRMRMLHVVRDPRAVAHSWARRVPRPEATATSPEQEMARYPPVRTAVQWMTQNGVLAALARRGVPTQRVRYEDFAAAPEAEFASIASFIGYRGVLPVDAQGNATLSAGHTVSGNPMRFTTGSVSVRADSSWRSSLAFRHRFTVSALTAPARWRYGY
ncbi:sulfotransferase [Nocardiopsis ansamitocini]|uniref:Sulfotransferase family protein n=1 Tax=Nocardiopsis ansamitocini TaxID=1670832 RepID=A0A9W6P4E2_9ACTN|nr:sulfotransferase [Nocardiopsis ansamitocini]GLU46903.1 sulfotransferase family protein [Nocardiopsis ansamitocini]